MKTVTMKLKIQPEIFNATKQFMEEKGLDIEQELSETVSKFYEKYVPSAVRKYIEKTTPISPLSLNSKPDSTDFSVNS
jgi:hypothetical protein